MTTDDKPSSAGGSENLAASIRRRREEEISLKEFQEKMVDLSGTIGAVGMSLVDMEKELTHQCSRAELVREEDLRRLKELLNWVERSLKELVNRNMEHSDVVRGQMERFREERAESVSREWRKILVVVSIACLVSGLAGWMGHARWTEGKSEEREAVVNQRALLGTYLIEEHRPLVDKHWQGFQDWINRDGLMREIRKKP